MTRHLSTLTLHQLRYGELEGPEAAQARAHLQTCERCSQLLQQQHAHREEFVLKPVPEALKELEGVPTAPWWRRLLVWGTPALALAAAILLVPTVLLDDPEPTQPEEIVTAKGGFHLEAWVDTPDGPMVLDEGSTLSAGDRVQLKFATQGRQHVGFGGIDGSGAVEVYGMTTGEGEGLQNAPFALTLDDSPGTQRFVAVFSDEELDEGAVREAISREEAPKEGILRSLTFRKHAK